MTIISGPNMLFNPSPCEELGRGDLSQFPCQQVFFPIVTKVPLITKVFGHQDLAFRHQDTPFDHQDLSFNLKV